MTRARVGGADRFALVYLVANTIMNVTTQDEQVAVFANAAWHLRAGGCFVLDVIVPQLRQVPRGEVSRVFTFDPDHVAIETFDDLVEQIAWSHHWIQVDGRLVHDAAPTGTCGRPSSCSWPPRRFPPARPVGSVGPLAVHLEQHP